MSFLHCFIMNSFWTILPHTFPSLVRELWSPRESGFWPSDGKSLADKSIKGHSSHLPIGFFPSPFGLGIFSLPGCFPLTSSQTPRNKTTVTRRPIVPILLLIFTSVAKRKNPKSNMHWHVVAYWYRGLWYGRYVIANVSDGWLISDMLTCWS